MSKGKNREVYGMLAVITPALVLSAIFMPWWAALAGAVPLAAILYTLYKRNKSIPSRKKARLSEPR